MRTIERVKVGLTQTLVVNGCTRLIFRPSDDRRELLARWMDNSHRDDLGPDVWREGLRLIFEVFEDIDRLIAAAADIDDLADAEAARDDAALPY